jgi:hypothetical protein
MKNHTIRKLVFILLLALSVSVFAQDKIDWAGLYGGVGAGFNSQKTELNSYGIDGAAHAQATPPNVDDLYDNKNFTSNKIIPNIHIGYNWQNNNILYGLETEFNYLNTSNSKCHPFSAGHHNAYGATLDTCNDQWGNSFFSVSTKWLSTINGKVGYAFNEYNFTLQGGLAFGEINSSLKTNCVQECGSGEAYPIDSNLNWSEIKYGWNLGGEIERKINKDWALFAKYKYVDLGSVSHSFNPNADVWPRNENGFSSKATYNILTFGANYYF